MLNQSLFIFPDIRLIIEQSHFQLLDLINEHIQIFEQHGKNKHITIINNIDKNLTIYADVNLLIILMEHLLSNAIKYSMPKSKVTLSAERKGDQVEFRVVDEGIGIDKDVLDKLFCIDQYHVTPGTANEKGTGLGLLICQVIAEKNGGSIEIKSEKGRGSTVIVMLPSH
jgi:signal transduction histidine kinase